MALVTGSAERRTGPWTYAKHALVHPWHLVIVAVAIVIGVANWSLIALLLAFATAELSVFGVMLRLSCFRRAVDARIDLAEHARAARVRTSLLEQMGEEQRRELARLENVVDRIRAVAPRQGPAAQLAVDECLGLLATYVRLAISYNVSRGCLATVGRGELDDEMRSLEARSVVVGPQARLVAQKRLAIVRKRAQRWDASRESVEQIADQLATVGALVQLTYEQLAAPPDPAGTIGRIDRFVARLDEGWSAIEELAEFAVEDAIEPRMLDVGRAA
ncbi:MAG: hypothetical protein ACRELB_02030 [Polyangiaceae bacterium]